MKKDKNELSNVHRKNVSSEFYQQVLELSASVQNQVIRLSRDDISSLIGTAKCFPDSYIQNVFNDTKTSLTGDVYLARTGNHCDDNLVLLAVRGGEDKKSGDNVMKTDTFVIKVGNRDTETSTMYACYHLDCTGRYTEPTPYASFRDSLSVGVSYDCEDSKLSSIMSPIRTGIEKTNEFIIHVK